VSWWESDPRYGTPGWTVITDDRGTRFVYTQPTKVRRKPRALRFAKVAPGDVLIRPRKSISMHYPKPLFPVPNDNERVEVKRSWEFAVVEDRWFDPCAGQADATAGEMVSVRWIWSEGVAGTKLPHTLRGLASNGGRRWNWNRRRMDSLDRFAEALSYHVTQEDVDKGLIPPGTEVTAGGNPRLAAQKIGLKGETGNGLLQRIRKRLGPQAC
jgi:hypothetical protein